MIQPDDILRKARNLYPAFLAAWLDGDSFFPRVIPARPRPGAGARGRDRSRAERDVDLAAAAAAVQRLREGSKETLTYGYTVEWVEINSRTYGRNRFPSRIVFETRDDYLQYVGRAPEFASFSTAVARLRAAYPELETWIRSNRSRLIEVAADVEGLLAVVEYLRAHPRPGLFAREIPVPVDTKFIERHSRILREWLDRVLPPHTIRADEEHFERRFGLRHAGPHVLVRFLDLEVQRAAGCPWGELSLPLHTLAGLPIRARVAIVVENKVNLLTLPPIAGAVALGGLGNGVTDLRHLPWLSACPLWYWGDLDVDGFAILARLRSLFPQTRSLLMDEDTLARWQQLAVTGNGRRASPPPGLTAPERSAFTTCAAENLRIEQERLPQTMTMAAIDVLRT